MPSTDLTVVFGSACLILTAFLCAEHFVFHLLQFISDEPFRVGDRLFAHIMSGDFIEMCLSHFDEIAEHIIEAYFQ